MNRSIRKGVGPERSLRTSVLFVCLMAAASCQASSLRISSYSQSRSVGEVEADYTTSHIYLNEASGDTVPITVFFDPGVFGVESAELFTNLNRRDRATGDANHDGVEDGILPPPGNSIRVGDDTNYYKAYSFAHVATGFQTTLFASKCGAYRLSARYRLIGDPPGIYRWYGDETNAQGIHKRDHALVISPSSVRTLRIYEANPLTVLATGTQPSQRGTLDAMSMGLPQGSGPRFSLSYLVNLGVNALWLQPIHPRGIQGRQVDPDTGVPFLLGSPYSVKNFFAVMPLLSREFVPGIGAQGNDSEIGRNQAMTSFTSFVHAADLAGVNVILDAPFNHLAPDAELSLFGQQAWGGPSPSSQIRDVEARVFSRSGEYDMRASNAATTANAPDRFDFGKWSDVLDVYFGRYASLVPNSSQSESYKNEEDWFDYSIGNENSAGMANGHFDAVTQRVWHYFGDCLQFWLTQSGYPANAAGTSLNTNVGVDGLRADFGQGLPPQCWEYLINRTRSRKWNFMFMAESLDGGQVTYRSARHFDILNERIIYDLHHAVTTSAYRSIYNQRRLSYGAAMTLLNTVSHDEDSYRDPYEALVRFAINSTMEGVTMIFSGQELGLRGTIVPPGDSVQSAGPPFGYEKYETPFFGKPIPAFKVFNSMMPLWRQNPTSGDTEHLSNLYGAIGKARSTSPALISSERIFLNQMNGAPNERIFSVAKFEKRNTSAKNQDVVLAFVNLTVGAAETSQSGSNFSLNVDADHDGMNDLGIVPTHLYNVKNIAAYSGIDMHRREKFLWAIPRTGADLIQNGIFIELNKVPSTPAAWSNLPFEPQYLKVFDVTP